MNNNFKYLESILIFLFFDFAGMIPHKTGRGQKALKRFQAFEGIPPTYTKVKRVCVPKAMKVMCLRSDRRVSCLK
jgi:hypothetical protein